jgi:hypothetical protein
MSHSRNLRGEPWQPCPQCPRRPENGGDGSQGVCPSRRVSAYCKHAAAHWIQWRDLIRGQPCEDRPGREPATPPSKPATPPPLIPLADSLSRLRWSRLARSCPWRDPCGCGTARCHRGDHAGELVSLDAVCVPCVETLHRRALPCPASDVR